MILPDLLDKDLDLVICGPAVGETSSARQAYYAGRKVLAHTP